MKFLHQHIAQALAVLPIYLFVCLSISIYFLPRFAEKFREWNNYAALCQAYKMDWERQIFPGYPRIINQGGLK